MEDGLTPRHSRAPAADWIQPPQEEAGLTRYAQTLRERIWIVVAAVAITTGIAVLYVATASKVYEAEADMLVTPVATSDASGIGVLPGMIPESSDPTRDVETASRLITNIDVADRVKNNLDSSESARDLLGKVKAEPVASSNIVAVTAEAGSPDEARNLANAFASQGVANQTEQLHTSIDQRLPVLEANLKQGTGDPAAIRAAISGLQTLRAGPTPSLSVETRADTRSNPTSPRPMLSIAGGLLAGLVLGIGGAFAYQAIDPRLRREEQLRRLYRLPILARIPKESRSRDRPLGPLELSPATSEAYRTLRGTLAVSRREPGSGSHAILVTGSSPSEGKTTTAINLSSSLATAGHNVILIEADLRRPGIAPALNLQSKYGVASVLVESVALQDALATTPTFGSNLGILLADYEGGWISDLFALPSARELIAEARRLADYVIIDSPPLTDVIDTLPLVDYVDDVVLVAGIGKTHLRKLTQLGELLAEHGVKPAGFAVVGTARPRRSEYHYYAGRQPRATPPPRESTVPPPRAGDGSPAPERQRIER
jgi:tyrosine-protein kinase